MKAGQIIYNKVNKERIKYINLAKDTNGEFVNFEVWVSSKGFMPVRHQHPSQKETIEVISGVLKVACDNKINYLKSGDVFIIDKGKPHQWWNESDTDEVHAIFTIAPTKNFEIMHEQVFGICNKVKKYIESSHFQHWVLLPCMHAKPFRFPTHSYHKYKLNYLFSTSSVALTIITLH